MDHREKQAQAHQEFKRRQEQKKKEEDRQLLADNLSKKLMTTGVGSLSIFEENFGYLWGHKKKKEDLTENEALFLELYGKVRDEVFDNINGQIRGMQAELNLHDIEYTGFKHKFQVRRN